MDFKIKLKQDGFIKKYKACLVAKVFKQINDVNYFDTFTLMTRISSIRVFIALASIHNLVKHQMNAKIAFEWGIRKGNLYGPTLGLHGSKEGEQSV